MYIFQFSRYINNIVMRHVNSDSQMKKEAEKRWEEERVELEREKMHMRMNMNMKCEVVTTQSVSHSAQPVACRWWNAISPSPVQSSVCCWRYNVNTSHEWNMCTVSVHRAPINCVQIYLVVCREVAFFVCCTFAVCTTTANEQPGYAILWHFVCMIQITEHLPPSTGKEEGILSIVQVKLR